jgi:hypothetical protein
MDEKEATFDAEMQVIRERKQAEFDQNPKEYLRMNGIGLNEATGLVADARNSCYSLLAAAADPSDERAHTRLKPISTYEEYLDKNDFPVGLKGYLTAQAKPESIEEFNRLAAQYNSEIENLKSIKNDERIAYFANAFEKLLK